MDRTNALLAKLDIAAPQGLSLCEDAAQEIRRLIKENEELRERHRESRADKLAAAYETLHDQALGLAEEINELGANQYYEDDFDLDEVGDKLRKKLKAIEDANDPDILGDKIVHAANQLPIVENELNNLYTIMAEATGLKAVTLENLGILLVDFKIENQTIEVYGIGKSVHYHEGSTATLVLKTGTLRGIEYLSKLIGEMNVSK